MASLLDKLQKASQAPLASNRPDLVKQMQTVGQSKTGKAGGPSNLGLNMYAQTAEADVAGQLGEVQAQGVQQAQAIGQAQDTLDTQGRQQAGEIDIARDQAAADRKIKTDQIFLELEQNNRTLDTQRKQALMEQAGQNIALQNRNYVDQLNREGQMARLNSDLEFRKAAQSAALEHNRALLDAKIGHNSLLDANDREFQDYMAKMDINQAIAIMEAQIQAANQRMQWEGVSNAVTGGIGAYNSASKNTTPGTTSTNYSSTGGYDLSGNGNNFRGQYQ